MSAYNDWWSSTEGSSINNSNGATVDSSDTAIPDILTGIDEGCVQADKLHLEVNLRSFRMLLRRAARRLTVAQFAELRRRYDNIWLEVLEEL